MVETSTPPTTPSLPTATRVSACFSASRALGITFVRGGGSVSWARLYSRARAHPCGAGSYFPGHPRLTLQWWRLVTVQRPVVGRSTARSRSHGDGESLCYRLRLEGRCRLFLYAEPPARIRSPSRVHPCKVLGHHTHGVRVLCIRQIGSIRDTKCSCEPGKPKTIR